MMHEDIEIVIDDCVKVILSFEDKHRLVSIIEKQVTWLCFFFKIYHVWFWNYLIFVGSD